MSALKRDDPYHAVYNVLRKNGICKICSYRFLGNAELSSPFEKILESRCYENVSLEEAKIKKENHCIICLGMFEEYIVENTRNRIVSKVNESSYDCETYMLALSLPASCQLREHSTFLFLKSEFPQLYGKCPYFPRINLKETWRFYKCASISDLINKKLNAKSPLIIQVTFSYVDDDKEFKKMNKILKKNLLKKKKSVSCCLELLNESDFMALYPFPMSIPNDGIQIESITIKRESIFFAGRYNKFSRELSQTPWILSDGERKMKFSVEEIISEKLKEIMISEDSRFSSSGREDVDVRTLGTGRPFAVELLNPHNSEVSFCDIRKVESEINKTAPHLIFVRDLQIIIDRSDLKILKHGEEKKTKEYCGICLVRKICDFNDLQNLLPQVPFVIQQKTPIRVLHRRTVATRPKVIHKISIHPVDLPCLEGCTIVKLRINTEAGTYIKEFVHGDFGRTQPNLSMIFNDIPVDVLALDVTNVQVDWPPPVHYEKQI